MRTLLNCVCTLTIAAAVWLGVMYVVLHRPGYAQGIGIACLFGLQSLLAIAVANEWVSQVGWKLLAAAGACGLAVTGVVAILRTLNAQHFEGYALIIGLLLVVQSLLITGQLITPLFTPSTKVHQFGN
jgi:hypothetical protein